MYSIYDEKHPGLGFDAVPDADSSFVYVLLDPRDGSVRYVGQTTDPKSRAVSHRRNQPSGNPHMDSWKAQLKSVGLAPRFLVVDSAPTERLDFMERRWIAYYRSLGVLLNYESGGQDGGRRAYRKSPPPKEKRSARAARYQGKHNWRNKCK